MISRRFHRRHKKRAEQLNITPIMNLMVILIPCLLITAVFAKMAILDIDLPSASNETDEPRDELHLEVVVRDAGLLVADGRQVVATLPKTAQGEYDYQGLSATIQAIKKSNPDVTHARVLLQDDTRYAVLIHVMDAVRMVRSPIPGQPGEKQIIPLFPDIALGDAP